METIVEEQEQPIDIMTMWEEMNDFYEYVNDSSEDKERVMEGSD